MMKRKIMMLFLSVFCLVAQTSYAATLNDDTAIGVAQQEAHIDIVYATAQGAAIAIGDNYQLVNSSAIVTKKPENATVTTHFGSLTDFAATGKTVLNVYSDTAGEVEVEILLSYQEKNSGQQRFVDGTVAVRFYEADQKVQQPLESAIFMVGQTTMLCNNQMLDIDGAPFIRDGRLYVPQRAFTQALNAEIYYNETTEAINLTKNNQTFNMNIDENIIFVNGIAQTIDTAPTIMDQRAYLPLRPLAEFLGYDLLFTTDRNDNVQTVIVTQ